jgi:hypothetical protein
MAERLLALALLWEGPDEHLEEANLTLWIGMKVQMQIGRRLQSKFGSRLGLRSRSTFGSA